jgi:hypothetical protein
MINFNKIQKYENEKMFISPASSPRMGAEWKPSRGVLKSNLPSLSSSAIFNHTHDIVNFR